METAMADIMDNSIMLVHTSIHLGFAWNTGKHHYPLLMMAPGMSSDEVNDIRLGSAVILQIQRS